MHTKPQAGSQRLASHQLANEVVDDPAIEVIDSLPETRRDIRGSFTAGIGRVEHRVGRSIGIIVLLAIVAGVAVNATPVWLASTTKQAQDENIREQRDTEGPPE